ncbi:MAG: ornithine cyclodeaminase family protein [Thermoleophilia bacterium]
MTEVLLFRAEDVLRAVTPERALQAVRDAFLAYAHRRWTMPPKVYVANHPAGDFRAMPALGDGHAVLKWVTSFPGNPAKGLPTVTGIVLLSDASDGRLLALLDAASVTALRTGAAAVLAADILGSPDATSAAVVGCGVNGKATARAFLARGWPVAVYDVDPGRMEEVAAELGTSVAGSLEEALAADLVATVTPGQEVVIPQGALRAGQHVSLMGADGPGKSEIAVSELLRCRLFCDDWEQASHGGELQHAVRAGLLDRASVTDLGAVLAGKAEGRRLAEEITAFDSTGLAIQDLAIALAALRSASDLDLPRIRL